MAYPAQPFDESYDIYDNVNTYDSIEWHEAKSRSNEKKHGIDFETTKLVFDDPRCISFIERVSDGEERWHAIGPIENIIVLLMQRSRTR